MTAEIGHEAGYGRPVRRSPLDGAAWGDPTTVSVTEVPLTQAVELRGHSDLVADRGIPLPASVGNTVRLSGGRRACCLGPAWWLVTAPAGKESLLADVASTVVSGAVVDVSAQRTRIDVAGPRWADLLRHVWARDLDALAVDRCAQGVLGRTQALLVREEDHRVAVHVRASFARYAYALLTDAGAEYV